MIPPSRYLEILHAQNYLSIRNSSKREAKNQCGQFEKYCKSSADVEQESSRKEIESPNFFLFSLPFYLEIREEI